MKEWIEPQPIPVPDALADAVGGHPLIAETLARRGQTDTASLRAFLNPDHYTPTPPSAFPDMDAAVDRVNTAIARGEGILVWGDFDVDGQTSTALLFEALTGLGANVTYHIPNRLTDGHGVHVKTLGRKIDDGAKLVLTCDTGVDAHEAVDYAASRGVDVLITDHHKLPGTLPNACAVVNPRRLPHEHPLRDLPGVGVAYKLVQALYGERSTKQFLDLVAMGIVADIAVQRGDTRYLLQKGLEALRVTNRLGLLALMARAKVEPGQVNEGHIGFALGPRLNALGRLADANPAVDLLTTQKQDRAEILANNLEKLNAERKFLVQQVYEGALAQIEAKPEHLRRAALVLAHPGWHTGVVGIVANRVTDDFNRPAVLLQTPAEGHARGSARSVYGCDITDAIAANADLLLGYGGHTMAAGLALEQRNIEAFARGLHTAVYDQLGGREITPTLHIDRYLGLHELTMALAEDIDRLAPFGPGNPPLTLATRNLRVDGARALGKRGDHLELSISDTDRTDRRVLWWNGGDPPEGVFDLAYTLRVNTFKGTREVLIEWLDARPAEGESLTLSTPTVERAFIDHRAEAAPEARLDRLRKKDPALVVWREGTTEVDGLRRDELTPAATLVVWTAPPGPAEWEAGLNAVSPETVYLFGADPGVDKLEPFGRRLVGVVKFVMNKRGGEITLGELAAAMAHRARTVRAGLDWLTARGQISVAWGEDDTLQISAAEAAQAADLRTCADNLGALLEETAAYRAYWRGAAF